MRRYGRSAFFLHTINFRWNKQAVPVHILRNVRVVRYVNRNGPTLSRPQKRTGDFIVVADSADNNLRSQLDQHWSDLQAEIGRRPDGLLFYRRHLVLRNSRIRRKATRLCQRRVQLVCPGCNHGGTSKPYKIPSLQAILIPAANIAIKTGV